VKKLPCFSGFSSAGGYGSTSKGLSSRSMAGGGQDRIKGPVYRLDDMEPSTGDSEENIIHPKRMNVQEDTRIEIRYEPRTASPQVHRQDW